MQGKKMASEETLLSLLKKARKGDDDAFRKLVEETRERIFGAIAAMTQREAIAEEILQEGYLALWDKSVSGDVEKPLRWLHRFCVNKSIDYLRRNEPILLENFDEEVERLPSNFTCPEIAVSDSERREALISVLQKLPHRERITLLMSDYLGMDSFEIASTLGTSPSTVRNQISSGRKKMLNLLKEKKID
jgi:RNA polymerase sigma-70 factor (ECF subfamily)